MCLNVRAILLINFFKEEEKTKKEKERGRKKERQKREDIWGSKVVLNDARRFKVPVVVDLSGIRYRCESF